MIDKHGSYHRKGWLSRVPRRRKRTEKDAQLDDINKKKLQKNSKKDTDIPEYAVIYIPLLCPKCKSKAIKCYSTDIPIRYHKCKNCGFRFKSVEK